MTRPIDLYYWPTPNGWKITILLEEVELPYNIVPVDTTSGDQFRPEFPSSLRFAKLVIHVGAGQREFTFA
jgi:hypothetical protein